MSNLKTVEVLQSLQNLLSVAGSLSFRNMILVCQLLKQLPSSYPGEINKVRLKNSK